MATALTTRLAQLEALPQLRLLVGTVERLPEPNRPHFVVNADGSSIGVEASLIPAVAVNDPVLLLELRGERSLHVILFKLASEVIRRR